MPTVKSYYQILEDTLIGRFLPAYRKRPKRRVIATPRFYFEEYRARRRILVSCDPRPRLTEQGIEIMPWRVFLEDLWSNRIMR